MLKWVVSLIALAGVITTWIVIPNVANGQSWAMPVMISVIVNAAEQKVKKLTKGENGEVTSSDFVKAE